MTRRVFSHILAALQLTRTIITVAFFLCVSRVRRVPRLFTRTNILKSITASLTFIMVTTVVFSGVVPMLQIQEDGSLAFEQGVPTAHAAVTFARAQTSASGVDTDPASATLGSTPTEGNLLVVIATERAGGDANNFTITGTGWTKIIADTTLPADLNARRTQVMWYKVAGASEPTTITVDDGTSNAKSVLVQEFTAGTDVTWTFQATTSANTGTGSASPLASGSTASVPAGDQLLVGSAVWRDNGTTAITSVAFSGLSGVETYEGGSNGRTIASAFAQESSAGTKSTSLSWTSSGAEANVGLAVFTAEEISPATDITVSGTLYENDGTTALGAGYTITAAVGTSTVSLHSTTTEANGTYSISGIATTSVSTTTPIVVFVDSNATTSSSTANTITNGLDTVGTIAGIDLYTDVVRLQHSSTTGGTIDLSDANFYDAEDDPFDLLFIATTSTTTINADLIIAANTTLVAPAHLVIDGDYTNSGTFNAASGEVIMDSTAFDIRHPRYSGQSVDAGDPTPRGFAFNTDGTKLYTGGNNVDEINEFTLSTAFDISTASFVQASTTNTPYGTRNPNAVAVSSDGTKLFIGTNDNDTVIEYALGTPWDVSTMSYTASTSVQAEESQVEGIDFSADGTRLYVVGSTGDDVNQYNLGTAWDITTATYETVYLSDTESGYAAPEGIAFNNDGTKFALTHGSLNIVTLFTLTTPWEVSTASYTGQVADIGIDSLNIGQDLDFNNDGTKLFVLDDSDGNGVYEYLLDSAQTATGTMTGTSAFYEFQNEAEFGLIFGTDASSTATTTFTTSAATTTFNSGSTYTFEHINWQGSSSTDLLLLRSSSDGSEWYLDVNSNKSVDYVDVKDSDATLTSGGVTVTTYGVDRLNNTNWFGLSALQAAISGTLYENDGTTARGAGYTITAAVGTSTPSLHSAVTEADGSYLISGIAMTDIGTWATTSLPVTGSVWRGSTYGNGRFVVVGDSGTKLAYSDDGINWTGNGTETGSKGVVYGNGVFVKVGQNGGTKYSYDGITWTGISAAGDNDNWTDVTYGNGRFVAVGSSGDKVMYSDDGITWATTTAAGDNDLWRGVTYGNGRYVAVGDSGDRMMYSDDGITWSVATFSSNNDDWYDVTYGDGYFVAVSIGGDVRIARSSDGENWSSATSPTASDVWYSITYGNGTFVAFGSSTEYVLGVSTDSGATFATTTNADNSMFWGRPVFGQNKFVFFNDDVAMYADAGVGENTPITVFVDSNATTSSTTANTITYGINTAATISDIDLYTDVVRLQHSSTSGSIDFADVNFYDYEDDAFDLLFTATTSTTTINADLLIAANTTLYAPQHLVIDGDFTNLGTFSAEGGEVIMQSKIADITSARFTGDTVYAGNLTSDDLRFGDGGSRLYTVGIGITKEVNEFTLSTPYDIGTAVLSTTTPGDISSTINDNTLSGLAFSTDGDKMYIVGDDNNLVYEFTLSTPWDVTSYSFVASTSAGDGIPTAVDFSTDGTHMYVLGETSDDVAQFDLSTPWDVTTATEVGNVNVGTSNFDALAFSDDGSVMVVAKGYNKRYELSTPWDVTTATLAGEMTTNGLTSDVSGIDFGDNDTVMITGSRLDDAVREFHLDTPQTATGTMTGTSAFYELQNDSELGLTFGTDASSTATTTITSDAATTTFAAGGTYTFENINWQGASSTSLLVLRSSSDGSDWYLDVNSTKSVDYVDVKDSDATLTSGGVTVTTYGVDSGNNTNWFDLTVTGIVISGTLYENDGTTAKGAGHTITAAVGTSTPSLHSGVTAADGTYSINVSVGGGIGAFATVTAPITMDVESIAYGNGRFVAVGASGAERVMYSDDGLNWATTSATENASWYDVEYAEGKFWAVSTDATVPLMYSADGITWSNAGVTFSGSNWANIEYGNGIFAAISTGCTAATSSDGYIWNVGNDQSVLNCWDLEYGNGYFVIPQQSGTVSSQRAKYSTDGSTYSSFTPIASYGWVDAIYGGGYWIVAGGSDGQEIYVTQGVPTNAWTNVSSVVASTSYNFVDSTYVNGHFVLVSNTATTGDQIYYSTGDPTVAGNWSTLAQPDAQDWDKLASGNGMIVGTDNGGDGGIMYADAGFGADTPIVLFVDSNATTSSSTANTITAGVNSGSSIVTIDSIDLYTDVVRLQHSSTTGTIYLADANVYDAEDNEYDLLFIATTSTTTINADLLIASNTTLYAPQHLVIDGDYTNQGTFSANGGEVIVDSATYDLSNDLRLIGTKSITTNTSLPNSIEVSSDGTNLYATNRTMINQYSLSTAWDVSTLSYQHATNSVTFSDYVHGVDFSPDGTYMFVAAGDEAELQRFTLGTAWDISTAVYDHSTTTGSPFLTDLEFKSDGTEVYWFEYSGDDLNTYTLSTPWDLTTADHDVSQTKDFTGVAGFPSGLAFNDDGTKMALVGVDNVGIRWYDLSTAYDPSTVSTYVDITDLSDVYISDVAFGDGGTKLYVMGGDDVVYQYALDSAQTATGTMTGTSAFYTLTNESELGLTFGTDASSTATTTITNSAATTTFNAGSTYTFENIVWQGSSSTDELYLRSSSQGTQWNLAVNGNATIEFVNVQDSDATLTTGGVDAITSTDAGNNTNWTFDGVQPWDATNWNLYDTITIDATNIDDDLTNFPVYVNLADLSSTFWATTPSASSTVGTDIRVTNSSNQELPRELVSASSTAETGELHFKADSISSTTATVFKIWYNGTTTGDYIDSFTYGAENVWNDYVVVWHMNELEQSDSAGNLPDRKIEGSFVDPSLDANGDLLFDSNDALDVDSADEGAGSLEGSYSSWSAMGFWEVNNTSQGRISVGSNPYGSFDHFNINTITGSTSVISGRNNSVTLNVGTTSNGVNRLQHATYNSVTDLISVYVDGELRATTSIGQSPDLVWDGWQVYRTIGTNYESRGAQVAFSAARIKAEYINFSTTTDFYTVAADSQSMSTTTLADSEAGQTSNAFSFQNKADEPVFTFNLSVEGEHATVTEMVIRYTDVDGIEAGEFTDVTLYIDENDDGELDGGDTLIEVGSTNIVGTTGSTTFTTDFTLSSVGTTNYLVTADITSIERRDRLTISLAATDITAVGQDTALTSTTTGSVESVTHFRSSGGGSSSFTDEGAPGYGIITGGTDEGGEELGGEPNFEVPTSFGSPHNEWTSGSNVASSDGAYASETTPDERLSLGDFGYTILSGETIQGIEVKLEASAVTGTGTIQVALSWDGGTSVTAVKETGELTNTDAIYTLGGSADTWGRSWTYDEFTNSNFRVRLIGQSDSNTVQVDAITVRVYHQVSGGGSGGGGGEI